MKKIKWTIMTLVILFSIGAAFATRPAKLQSGLYYWTGSMYLPAGSMGQTYICTSPATVACVYTYANGVYTPYINDATYTILPAFNSKIKPAAKKGN